MKILIAFVVSALSSPVGATVQVFNCNFPEEKFEFVATIYDDDAPARVGVEVGIGNRATTFVDQLTGAISLIEFIDGGRFPTTLTTILPDGAAFHSRHSLSLDGSILESQMRGECEKLVIE